MSIESTSIEFEGVYAEYCAVERERLLREHGGKQLVAWWRRDQQWSVLFELGFGDPLEVAELCDERVFGEPPGEGLWLWSGAFEYRQQGYEEVEYEPVALGKWRRLTEPELDRVRNGATPWQRPWPPDEMRSKVWTKAELEREHPLGHGFEWMLTAAGWSAFRLRKGCTSDQLVLESDGRLSGDATAVPAVVVLQFLRALVPTRGAP
ncbi:MAG: hypothetical protein EKK60_10705 [Gordonia sp. (in: high G+C Gram-positive bacteria)]|nr:MAG: hypothetical protein EKK60_10705 [Gordonia sp. (in: high G+C Gram-positive bacteria)]